MEKKKLNKTTKSNLITYGMVLAAYLIVQGMIAGNLLSNLMQGSSGASLCIYYPGSFPEPDGWYSG